MVLSFLAVLGFLPGVSSLADPAPLPTFVNERSDLNQDHVVDSADLLILMRDWGRVSGPEKVIPINLPNLPDGSRPMRMVRIPAGSFLMGSPETERGRYPREGPRHPVTIPRDFYFGETTVTEAQWRAVMGAPPPNGANLGNDYPVYQMSWNDITQPNGFLDRLNALGLGSFRLPTEAEWEYACRAGTSTRFFFGDSLDCGDTTEDCAAGTLPGNRSDYMWYAGNNSPRGVKPVAGKLPNGFGLYDMHGNLWEWCQDHWHEDFVGAPEDGSAWIDSDSLYRVIRGSSASNHAGNCRAAFRAQSGPPMDRTGLHGMRLVMVPIP